jgi:hypothetical protein
MALTSGTVTGIKISQDLCFFEFAPAAGGPAETLILWASPPPITAAQWILNNAILPILRDAFANNTTITVGTDTNSAIVTQVRLGQT